MTSFSTFSGLFSLLLFAGNIVARQDPGNYWRSVMKEQPIPESIHLLVNPQIVKEDHIVNNFASHDWSNRRIYHGQDPRVNSGSVKENQPMPETGKQNHFAKDFVSDEWSIRRIYHRNSETEEEKPSVSNIEPSHCDGVKPAEGAKLAKDVQPKPNAPHAEY